MEWAQVVGIASWCFLIGIFVGQAAEKVHGEKQGPVGWRSWFASVKQDIANMEKFAAMNAVVVSVITDTEGMTWRVTVEKEREEA